MGFGMVINMDKDILSKEELIQKISDIKDSAWGYHIGGEVMGIPYDEFIEIMDSVLHYLKNPDSNNN